MGLIFESTPFEHQGPLKSFKMRRMRNQRHAHKLQLYRTHDCLATFVNPKLSACITCSTVFVLPSGCTVPNGFQVLLQAPCGFTSFAVAAPSAATRPSLFPFFAQQIHQCIAWLTVNTRKQLMQIAEWPLPPLRPHSASRILLFQSHDIAWNVSVYLANVTRRDKTPRCRRC